MNTLGSRLTDIIESADNSFLVSVYESRKKDRPCPLNLVEWFNSLTLALEFDFTHCCYTDQSLKYPFKHLVHLLEGYISSGYVLRTVTLLLMLQWLFLYFFTTAACLFQLMLNSLLMLLYPLPFWWIFMFSISREYVGHSVFSVSTVVELHRFQDVMRFQTVKGLKTDTMPPCPCVMSLISVSGSLVCLWC